MREIRLADIKRKINSFDWEGESRNFREDQSHLNKKYWECVSGDILYHLGELLKFGSQDFNKRFYDSFLGCYYFRYRLEKAILSEFTGYRKYIFPEEQEAWEEWKKELIKAEKEFLFIPHLINEHRDRYIKGPNYSDISIFDDWHQNKAEKISDLLKPHINASKKFVALRKPPKVYLYLTLNERGDFIKTLLKYAHRYCRVMVLKNAMIQVESQFSEGKNEIAAFEELPPIEAVRHLLSKKPGINAIPAKRLAYYIIDTYRDEKGLPIAYESALTAVKRIRSSG